MQLSKIIQTIFEFRPAMSKPVQGFETAPKEWKMNISLQWFLKDVLIFK